MKVGGYAGQVLYIDLTSKAIRKEPLDMNMARKHLGGFGLNCKFAWDLLDPAVDPLSPENIIFMGMGPMLGTAAPAANKHSVMTKWPSTGTISPGTAGGDFGINVKLSGYDEIIITGKPVLRAQDIVGERALVEDMPEPAVKSIVLIVRNLQYAVFYTKRVAIVFAQLASLELRRPPFKVSAVEQRY